jgi:hypothetical protein
VPECGGNILQLKTAIDHGMIGSLAGTLMPAVVADLINRFKVRECRCAATGLATSNDNALVRREADLFITSDRQGRRSPRLIGSIAAWECSLRGAFLDVSDLLLHPGNSGRTQPC